jgi:hypothetical protein
MNEEALVEVSHVNRRVKAAIEQARTRTQTRRQRMAEAEKAYAVFLEQVATPVTRQLANALKAAGLSFTVGSPGDSLRLSADRGRDDFIEFGLDTSGDAPQVVGRVRVTRGSRTMEETLPIKAGAAPTEIGEEDVLEFLVRALEPWLER